MAFLGQLGPLWLLCPQGQVGSKPQLDLPEPILAINPLDPNLAKNPLDTKIAIDPIGPIFGHGPPWTIIPAMASGNHQRPTDQLSNHSPQLKGNSIHSSMHPVLKVAGVVHIWYYIPLYTIFAQEFNGDAFRTKSHNFESRFQNPTPILKEDSLTHHSGAPWRQSEDHSIIPITWPCRSWVGNFHSGLFQGLSQRLYSLPSSCQVIKYFNTPWTTELVHTGVNQSTGMYLSQLGQFIFHCGNSVTQFNFQDGHICIEPIQTTQPVTYLPGSVFQLFTYTGHL
ncbi:hypothetical protein O181_100655 [Austropuccinia psidii MF-1]|uniref:Uncharacterized protein n=1 Tax=Austropuccinia psidii MF-1 TaxID=1389203 RepID=A0A9Q3JD38_9BASI|nr:hypothetical protein [Austropuccinia psidii MF-1]